MYANLALILGIYASLRRPEEQKKVIFIKTLQFPGDDLWIGENVTFYPPKINCTVHKTMNVGAE